MSENNKMAKTGRTIGSRAIIRAIFFSSLLISSAILTGLTFGLFYWPPMLFSMSAISSMYGLQRLILINASSRKKINSWDLRLKFAFFLTVSSFWLGLLILISALIITSAWNSIPAGIRGG